MNYGRGRGWDPARPHLSLFADLSPYSGGRSAKNGWGVAPRHQLNLFGGAAAAGGDGGGDGFGTEEALDVEEGAGGAVVEGAVAAPKAELATFVGKDLLGGET
jgi:hypothetical protein